jgi:serine/threonine protein kinase
MPTQKKFHIIGQGTYGCAIHPEINCKTKGVGSSKKLSKIQILDKYSKMEIAIGNYIKKKIPHYSYYFAPIIGHCGLKIADIQHTEVNKCEILYKKSKSETAPENKFINSKIAYVGKQTFEKYFTKYLEDIHTHPHPHKKRDYLKAVLDAEYYLLNSIDILYKNGLLHLDLKHNNIMYNAHQKAFVIIDFGFAIQREFLTFENITKHKFGIATNSYFPWCVEIILLSQIWKWQDHETITLTEKITDKHVDDLKRICSEHITTNQLFNNTLFTQKDATDFEALLHTWIVTFKGKTWKDMWNELIKSSGSWDNYSIAVMILNELDESNIFNALQESKSAGISSDTILEKYVAILKARILCLPDKRPTAEQSIVESKKTFKVVDKTDVLHELYKTITAPENIRKIRMKKAKVKTHDVEKEKEMKMHVNV